MRRFLTGLIAALAVFLQGAFAEEGFFGDNFPDESAPVQIEMAVQFYGENGTILEIPRFVGAENTELAAINAELEALYSRYATYETDIQEACWCEVRCYPVSGGDYTGVLLTACEYPIYGTSGDIYGFIYDRAQERRISTFEALELIGVGEGEIRANFSNWLSVQEGSEKTLKSLEIAAFRICEDGSIVLYLEADVATAGADSWKDFYTWENGEITCMNGMLMIPIEDEDTIKQH